MITTPRTAAPDVLNRHNASILPVIRPYYDNPLILHSGSGTMVWDVDGNAYLDLFAGILTTSIGHCHPEVVKRVQEQVARLGHTSTLYVTEQQVAAAETLASLSPGSLVKTIFTNSGTEAIESAIMLARMYTGRSEIVALRQSYSGRSSLATTLTGQAPWRPPGSNVSGIVHAISPYTYRSPFADLSEDEAAQRFADDLEEVIVTTTTGRPAALLAETIQGVAGYVVPPRGYFRLAADIIHKYGGLLIIDEVQTGFGRTGTKWFGIEHWGVEPDIMVMAKGIANGFPVGATITRDEIAQAWTTKTISTYGGNPISMAAMNATLDVMQAEDVPARSALRGAQLRAGLEELYQRHDWIGEVRGMGLMQAMELVEDRYTKEPSPARAKALLEACKDEGLLVGIGGLRSQVVRMGPSMLISEVEMEDALGRLGRACRRVDKSIAA